MQHGLIPHIGTLSKECNETKSRIYLFPDIQTMETALSSWLGEMINATYGEDVHLCSLKIVLPDKFPIEQGEVEYEVYANEVIPPRYISYLKDE